MFNRTVNHSYSTTYIQMLQLQSLILKSLSKQGARDSAIIEGVQKNNRNNNMRRISL